MEGAEDYWIGKICVEDWAEVQPVLDHGPRLGGEGMLLLGKQENLYDETCTRENLGLTGTLPERTKRDP